MKKFLIILGIICLPINGFSSELLSKIDLSKVDKTKGIHVPYKKNPNLETLKYFLYRYITVYPPSPTTAYIIEPASKPYEFKFDLAEYKFLNKEMERKGLVSYLYFDKDHIVIDKISPNNRLGEFVNNKTKLRANSVGKSMVSYVLGHAICEGYIDSVDSRINDWDLVKDTLYENHKLIDLLNMASGDQKYVYASHMLENGKINTDDINDVGGWKVSFYKYHFKDKKSIKKQYNYNVINTNLILNYVLFKSKGNFQKILNKTFQEKSKIKDGVYFFKKREAHEKFGNADPMFYATRLDYLRIAKAMMDDYQNNTCVGKYLKEIYDRRIPKNINNLEHTPEGDRSEPRFNRTSSYGGQFHMDYPGLKDRVVFGMGGYGGQAILIDVENSRIVVVNSIHYNNTKYKYNHKKLLIDPIKLGKKSFKK